MTCNHPSYFHMASHHKKNTLMTSSRSHFLISLSWFSFQHSSKTTKKFFSQNICNTLNHSHCLLKRHHLRRWQGFTTYIFFVCSKKFNDCICSHLTINLRAHSSNHFKKKNWDSNHLIWCKNSLSLVVIFFVCHIWWPILITRRKCKICLNMSDDDSKLITVTSPLNCTKKIIFWLRCMRSN